MDELEQDFIDEICHMRMDIAYQRLMENRTRIEAERVIARDEAIDVLYDMVAKECTEAGKKILFKYADEIAYRESEDADFYYKTGFSDGVQLIIMLQKMAINLQ